MNKNFYIAITIKENEKYFSYVLTVNNHQNLLSALKIQGIDNATICTTRKQAKEIATRWNAAHKANNNFLFDYPTF